MLSGEKLLKCNLFIYWSWNFTVNNRIYPAGEQGIIFIFQYFGHCSSCKLQSRQLMCRHLFSKNNF